jgi:hypothetical protein
MLYDLPTGPTVTVVSPDDTDGWTALGVDPAGRYALVIGDPAGGHDAIVVAGRLSELSIYLDPVHGTLAHALAAAYEQTQGDLRDDEPARRRRADTTPALIDAAPALDLVTLPHTGIRVPGLGLQVTSLRQLRTPDGVAYTATLRLGPTPVGTIANEGNGGATVYHPTAGSPFDRQQLAAFVAASRTADGQPMPEEQLLEELISEYENVKHVTQATRARRSPVRLMAPIGDRLDAGYATVHRTTAAKIATAAQRAALITDLQRRQVDEGVWWQLWTGQRWEDLTAPPPPAAGEKDVS